MVVAYQLILLITIIIAFIGVVGEQKDKELRDRMLSTFIVSAVLFVVSVLWL